MALSEMTVRHARITGNDYTLGGMDGLALHVTARGGKVWLFRYYWAGCVSGIWWIGWCGGISAPERAPLQAQAVRWISLMISASSFG